MKPKSRREDLVVQNSVGETLVYDLLTNTALVLNETSAFIWALCDGSNDISQIQKRVSAHFKQPTSEDLVWLAIEQLKKDNLLEHPTELPNHFAGLNRREVVKKVGFGTMIALPLILSLVAPSPLNAQSSPVSCTLNTECTTFCCIGMVCVTAQQVPFMGACVDDCQCFQFCNAGTCL